MGALISEQPGPSPVIERSAPSLRSNFQWTLAGNVIYAVCQWGMLSILAKAGNPAIVGRFALGLAIAAPVFMLTNLQLRSVKATDARSDFEFADYFTLRVLTSLFGLFLVGAVAVMLPYDVSTRLVVLLLGASKAIDSLSDVVAGLLQKHERLDQVAISLIVRGVASLAVFAVVFLWTRNLAAASLSMVAAWLLVFLFYDLGRARALLKPQGRFFRLRAREIKRLLLLSMPLGIVMTLISLNVNIPRYILVKYLGEADLGIFASMAYTLVAVNLIVNALGQSATARLARMFASGDVAAFRRIMRKLLLIGVAILVVGPALAAVAGRPLLTILYKAEYATDIKLLVVMAITSGISAIGSFLGYGMTSVRSFRMQVPVIGLSTATTVVLSWLLVTKFGLMGAALALLASSVVFAVGSGGVLSRSLRSAQRGGH